MDGGQYVLVFLAATVFAWLAMQSFLAQGVAMWALGLGVVIFLATVGLLAIAERVFDWIRNRVK